MGNFIRATGSAFSLADIFINFPYKKLKMGVNDCQRINGDRHRNLLVQKIFKDHMKMVMNDVIDNNVTFVLPTGSRRCEIRMRTIKDNDFKNLKRSGKWKGVDFLKSWFTGNQLSLFMMSPKRPDRVKNIYVNSEMTRRIDEYTNEGKTYC